MKLQWFKSSVVSTKFIKMFIKRSLVLVVFAFASAQCIRYGDFIMAPNIKLSLKNITNSEEPMAIYNVSPINTNGSFPFNLQRYLRIFYFQTFHQTIYGGKTVYGLFVESTTKNQTSMVQLERGSFHLDGTRINFKLSKFLKIFFQNANQS